MGEKSYFDFKWIIRLGFIQFWQILNAYTEVLCFEQHALGHPYLFLDENCWNNEKNK